MSVSEARGAETKLLIVDDDPSMVSQLQMALSDDFVVRTASSPETAWEIVQQVHPDLITLDLALDGKDPETGFSLLETCLRFDPFTKIVLITGNDDHDNALRAVEHGAADFLGKPVNADELLVLLRRLRTIGELERKNARRDRSVADRERLGMILGKSPEMRRVFGAIETVAPKDISVLILGPSGTGKELAAQEIHRLSARASKPFVTIDCGAIPENLLESELFGHEKGSFTGAHITRAGCLETAGGGTVFLDEVAELPLALQVKLLRFLQSHEIQRIGGRRPIKLDVRVIAATNRELDAAVKDGAFREDLYYRISVVNLFMPALKDRPEDILLLARSFLGRFAAEFGRGQLNLTARAKAALREHEWPGNVGELEHVMQRAALVSHGRSVDAADLGFTGPSDAAPHSLKDARVETDRRVITDALRRTAGNVSQAAKLLDISRPSLYELLLKLDVEAGDFRGEGPVGSKGG